MSGLYTKKDESDLIRYIREATEFKPGELTPEEETLVKQNGLNALNYIPQKTLQKQSEAFQEYEEKMRKRAEAMFTYQDTTGIKRVILNPKVPIPMQICRICWNILDDDTAYCRRCGHIGTVFSIARIPNQKCFSHKSKDAVHFCNLCGRSFCDECLETNKGAILSMGTYSHHCHLCLSDIDRIKQQQSKRDKTICSRHTDMHVRWNCVACGDGLCSFCAYHPVVGLFKKRVENTIFCFHCIRSLINEHKFNYTVIDQFAKVKFQDHMF